MVIFVCIYIERESLVYTLYLIYVIFYYIHIRNNIPCEISSHLRCMSRHRCHLGTFILAKDLFGGLAGKSPNYMGIAIYI